MPASSAQLKQRNSKKKGQGQGGGGLPIATVTIPRRVVAPPSWPLGAFPSVVFVKPQAKEREQERGLDLARLEQLVVVSELCRLAEASKRKEAEAAGRKKLTKQQEKAGKSKTQKREEQKAKKAAKSEEKAGW